ncbi:MAG: phosphate ABC transporter permease PstA, partial [Lachnospiraceae bacterium]
MNDSILVKRKRPTDNIIYALIFLSAFISVAILVGIIVYVVVKGIGQVNWSFLTTARSAIKGTNGIAGNIVNTLYIVIITVVIATPIGVGSAIYLNEYAHPGKLVRLIEFTTETLSGIPSIIFGMFGLVLFNETFHLGYSIITGCLTLTLMVLPLITRNTQEALKTVPKSYRDGALGMGAGKWHMIRTIILPSAMPGIITGIILAIGRIVGESAALLFTAGAGYTLPKSFKALFEKITQAGGSLTIEMYFRMQNGKYGEAFGIGVVLLVIVLIINFATKLLA